MGSGGVHEARRPVVAQLHRDHGFGKPRQHRQGLPPGVEGQAGAVKNKFVVAAHLVDVDKRHPGFPGVGLHELEAQGSLSPPGRARPRG